jgi:hypothetical protein
MIPKIIHYCWFGNSSLPKEFASYIKEWRTLNPGFKIIQWDEKNSPITVPYMKTALTNNNWSNATNYMRFYALKEHGGIYMDTDIKLIKPLLPFLENECFMGFEEGSKDSETFWVNNAVIGSIPHHPFVKLGLESLVKEFDGSEQSNFSGPRLATKLLKEHYGLKKYGFQKLDGITLYPKDFFHPIPWDQAYQVHDYHKHITNDTVAIHVWARTWFTKELMLNLIDDLQKWKAEKTVYINQLISEKQKYEEVNKLLDNQSNDLKNYVKTLIIQNEETINHTKEELKSVEDSVNKLLSDYRKNQEVIESRHIKGEAVINRMETHLTELSALLSETYSQQVTLFYKFENQNVTIESKINDARKESNNQFSLLRQDSNNQFTLLNSLLEKFEINLREKETKIKEYEWEVRQKDNALEWYRNTYERRSILGILKDRLLKKTSSSDSNSSGSNLNQFSTASAVKTNVNHEATLSDKTSIYNKELLKRLYQERDEKKASLEWYERTYGNRSLISIIKDRLFKS